MFKATHVDGSYKKGQNSGKYDLDLKNVCIVINNIIWKWGHNK